MVFRAGSGVLDLLHRDIRLEVAHLMALAVTMVVVTRLSILPTIVIATASAGVLRTVLA